MSAHSTDRGLRAVARVREVRERDSRLGLMAASSALKAREEEVARRVAALEAAAGTPAETMADYVVARIALAAMAEEVRDASRRAEAGRTVAAEAQVRWSRDRSRLEAVDRLLERRAERRAEEVLRAEDRELDDVIGRLWAHRPDQDTGHNGQEGQR